MARIAFISTMSGCSWGGSEELWSQTALRLKEQGHETFVSVYQWPVPSAKIALLQKGGVQMHFRSNTFWGRNRQKLAKHLGFPQARFEWIKKRKADLVVISQGGIGDGLEWIQYCEKLRIPFATVIQANAEQWWPDDAKAGEMRKSYRQARRIYFVSQANCRLFENQIGGEMPNTEVVWNPVNLPEGEALDWPDETTLRLACVGRLEPDAKGQDILFQVLARPEWRDRSVEVNLFGSGRAAESLRSLKERLHLDKVHFRSHVADIREVWKNHHLLVLPSRYEGLPLALVEAMKCGRPAVVTDVAGNCEVALHGETAFVAPAPTVPLFSEALEKAWAHRKNWQAMGENARNRIDALMPADPVQTFSEALIRLLKFQFNPSRREAFPPALLNKK